MGNIVLKIPGAGMINVIKHDTSIPWHGYRGIHIVPDFFYSLMQTLKNIKATERVFFSCGSTGSFLYTDLAKCLDITNHKFLDEIGISITTAIIKILTEFLLSNGLCVCPHSMACCDFSPELIKEYQFFFHFTTANV